MIKLGFIGGAEEIGKSMIYIEYDKSAIVVDCGMQFPSELELFGVNKIVPSTAYLRQNVKKIKGLFITHLHEDHIGGIRRFCDKYNVPIYAEDLTCEYLKIKNNFREDIEIKSLVKNKELKLGSINIRPFEVEHSTIKAFGYEIKTKHGNIVLTGDYKLGHNYNDALNNLKKWGVDKNPLMLICESTNSNQEGYSKHESDIINNIENLIKKFSNEIFIISTFASSMERLKNIINVAQKNNKDILILGRNMEISVNFLIINKIISNYRINFLSDDDCNIKDDSLVLSTGCQGEINGGLYKLIQILKNKKNKHVLFSSSIIPGNEKQINEIKCELLRNKFDYIDDSTLYHTSGHAKKEEIKCLITYLKPKYFVPIHGDYIKQISNKENAIICGINEKNIIVPENNLIIKFKKGNYIIEHIKDSLDYITSCGIVNSNFIEDKKQAAKNGIFIYIVNQKKIKFSFIGIIENSKITKMGKIFARDYQYYLMKSNFDETKMKSACIEYLSSEIKNSTNMPYIEIISLEKKKQEKNKDYIKN